MPETKQLTTCFHCGEDCHDEVIHHHDHDFCCVGCRTVYTLLEDTGLGNYYSIENSPGRTQKPSHTDHTVLDLDEVRAEILDFSEGNRDRVTLYLPSLHCAACIWLLEKLNRLHHGVYRSDINYLRKELTVHFDAEKLSLKQLVELLEDLGYPPDLQRKKGSRSEQKGDRELIVKLGIAGFVFGNIMLLSFPEYMSVDAISLRGFSELFGWINLMLAIPVLVYCDRDYLISAWKSLKVKYLTIDVPISLGIITLFARSAFEIISSTGAGYFDSFAGLVFFLLVGKWFQSRTYSAIAFDRDFKSYFPMAVSKLDDGEESVVLIEKIKKGDRLRILNNQIIPADCILSNSEAIVDYSFVSLIAFVRISVIDFTLEGAKKVA